MSMDSDPMQQAFREAVWRDFLKAFGGDEDAALGGMREMLEVEGIENVDSMSTDDLLTAISDIAFESPNYLQTWLEVAALETEGEGGLN